MVELAESGRGAYRLERYVIEPLPKDAVTDGNITNLDATADTVKRAYKKLGSRIRNVAMALPVALVITKKIILPGNQREEDMEQRIVRSACRDSSGSPGRLPRRRRQPFAEIADGEKGQHSPHEHQPVDTRELRAAGRLYRIAGHGRSGRLSSSGFHLHDVD